VFGDVTVEDWAPSDTDMDTPPWVQFARARQALEANDPDSAIELWSRIAATQDLESRQVLQAWTFLRQAGHPPTEGEAKTVLGVVVEMPAGQGHDLIAAYADGSARYLNHAGGVAVLDEGTHGSARAEVDAWLEIARSMVQSLGPWDQRQLPALPLGDLRVMILTPSGPHFGQGPRDQLMADPMAALFVQAAATLLQVLTEMAGLQP
jgi:hypothetical protein